MSERVEQNGRLYSVRRARRNLILAIRDEVESSAAGQHRRDGYPPHTTLIARREAAIRNLIASVRAEAPDARA